MQRSRKTQFMKAVESGDTRRLGALLADGADPNFPVRGETPLIWALLRGQEDIAKLLVDAGADVNAAAADGATALFWAARYGFEKSVRLPLAAGADVHAFRDHRDLTPLAIAVSNGHVEVARILIEHGADAGRSYLDEYVFHRAKPDAMSELLQGARRRA